MKNISKISTLTLLLIFTYNLSISQIDISGKWKSQSGKVWTINRTQDVITLKNESKSVTNFLKRTNHPFIYYMESNFAFKNSTEIQLLSENRVKYTWTHLDGSNTVKVEYWDRISSSSSNSQSNSSYSGDNDDIGLNGYWKDKSNTWDIHIKGTNGYANSGAGRCYNSNDRIIKDIRYVSKNKWSCYEKVCNARRNGVKWCEKKSYILKRTNSRGEYWIQIPCGCNNSDYAGPTYWKTNR